MPQYISLPIVVDPDVLAAEAIAEFQTRIPGWVPADGNPEVINIEANARIAAEIGTIASAVDEEIVTFLGPLMDVDPIRATPASVESTWTVVDNLGYTIPGGTTVNLRAVDGSPVPFQVLGDTVIPPGSTVTATGAVTLVAVDTGDAGSGLGGAGQSLSGGDLTLVDVLAYVTEITLTDITTGGVDAETTTSYLNRFVTEMTLIAPRPILPGDAALLALDTPGVARALVLDGYNPSANELQTVTVVNATGGTFTLTFGGQTTSAIARNASAAAVQAALEALSSIGAGNVACTGGPLGTAAVQIEFKGTLAGTNVAQITATDSTTGTGHAVNIATTRGGSATNNNPRMMTVVPVDVNGAAVGPLVKTALQASLEAKREVNFIVNVIDATYTEIDVQFTFSVYPGFDPAEVKPRAEAEVAAYLSPATWGTPTQSAQTAWVDKQYVRLLELATVINNVQGLDEITPGTLLFCVHGGTPAATDIHLGQPAGLPTPGTIVGTAA